VISTSVREQLGPHAERGRLLVETDLVVELKTPRWVEPLTDKRVAIVQSNYIPWKGYFDLIGSVDEFILLDEVQYTRRDWRNRNRIKTPNGTQWLTIPVETKGKYTQKISETLISDPEWVDAHWRTLVANYARAPHFGTFQAAIRDIYNRCETRYLSEVNRLFIVGICELLGVSTRLTNSSDYDASGVKTARLVSLCEQAGATTYLSGPSARAYLDEAAFAERGIAVEYMNYDGYPEYPQLYPPFEHAVTVLDLLFNTGPSSPLYLKVGRSTAAMG
jgi:hypothetical protein